MTENYGKERKTALVYGKFEERSSKQTEEGKLSCMMALLLGIFCTLELMTAGAMVLNIDIHSADMIAIFFVFVVIYFGVVAVLTDK